MTTPTWYGPYSYDQKTCPKCGSAEVSEGNLESTLVGYTGGPENNPNHFTSRCLCRKCSFEYARHWQPKSKNAWATLRVGSSGRGDTYAIAGYPSCCASLYIAHCKCGGWVESQQRDKSVRYTYDDAGDITESPPPIWGCSSCGYSGMKPFGASDATRPVRKSRPRSI